MTTRKLITQIGLGLTLMACHPTQGNGPHATTPIGLTSESSCKIGASENPFSCLVKKCKNAGGTYLPFRQMCDCGEDKTFVGWGEGQCRPIQSQNKCLKAKKGFSYYKRQDETKFLECLAPLHSSEGTSVNVQPLFENSDFDAFAEWADVGLPAAFTAMSQQATFFQMASVNWLIGPSNFDSLDEATLARLTTPFTVMLASPKESTPVQISYYFEKGDNINELFLPQEESETLSIENPVQTLDRESAKTAHAVLKEVLGQVFQANEKQFFTDDGCAGHCQLRQVAKNYSRIREYIGGHLFSDQVLVWEDPQHERAVALAQLLPSGQISLVHTFDRKYTENTKALTIRYQVYDRHWRPLLSQGRLRNVVADLGKFEEASAKMANASAQEPQAIVCESGFDIDSLIKLGPDTMVLGPLRNKSLFGWVDGQRTIQSPIDYIGKFSLAGVSEFTDTGTRLPFINYSEHAVKVGRKITDFSKDIRLIPISFGICADHGDRWYPQIKAHTRAKVVNWSAALSYTKAACANSPFAKQIKARENDLLYVVGAGNDSLNGDAQPIPICPQGLAGAPNLIVTAAGQDRSLAWVSNYGTKFADIIADGSHTEEGNQNYTTSLAAPAVTKVAAMLSFQYPKLTPKQIRKAILFGARIPTNRNGFAPMPVRSGGFLDEAGAEAFAALFDREPGINDAGALSHIYCRSSRRAHCNWIEQRVQILKQNLLVEN